MQALPVRQCPRCVLRFGSSSELEQHLRLDHPPAPRPPEPLPTVAEPPGETDEHASAESSPATHRVVEAVIAVALIALIAVFSWHVAALVSIALVAAVAVRASARAGSENRS